MIKLKTKTFKSLLIVVFWEILAQKYYYLILAILFEVGYLIGINSVRYIYAKKY